MQVVIVNSAHEAAILGSRHCYDLIKKNPTATLGLATGSTPLALYQELITLYRQGALSFKDVKSFNLDEYIGLSPSHPQSYHYFMKQHLFSQIDIQACNTTLPDGLAKPDDAAREYEQKILDNQAIDLQILGLGRNGHIGFNEPSSSLMSRTRIKTLTQATIEDNSRFFATDEFQPSLAITMGIGTILEAKKVLLLATGSAKAQAVKSLIEGPLSASCPASALQLHNDTIVIVDEAAAEKLTLRQYYQTVRLETDRLAQQYA